MQTLSTIDMFSPAEAMAQLKLDAAGLLDSVNNGQLAAFNFDGDIRFKVIDVMTAADRFVAA